MNLKNLSPVHLIAVIITAIFTFLSMASCSKEAEPLRPDITGRIAINVADYTDQMFTVHAGDIVQSRLSSSDDRGIFWANQGDAINFNNDKRIASAYVIWVDYNTYYAWKERRDDGIHLQPLRPNRIM